MKKAVLTLLSTLPIVLTSISQGSVTFNSLERTQELFCEDQTIGEQINLFLSDQISDQDRKERLASRNSTIQMLNSPNDRIKTIEMEQLTEASIPLIEASPSKIQYRVVRKEPKDYSSSRAKKNDWVAVIFDSLSNQQFEYLKNLYGQGHSTILYAANTTFQLQDFLPIGMQIAYEMSPITNCWGFIANYLDTRRSDFRDSAVSHDALVSRLQDQKYFRRVRSGETLLPGDIIVSAIRGQDASSSIDYEIDHIVIYLDDNLTIGSNPGEIQLGKIMEGRYQIREGSATGMKPFGDLFHHHKFEGQDYEITLLSPLREQSLHELVYRRTDWSEERLPLRLYKNHSASFVAPIQYDNLGRARINRNHIHFCK